MKPISVARPKRLDQQTIRPTPNTSYLYNGRLGAKLLGKTINPLHICKDKHVFFAMRLACLIVLPKFFKAFNLNLFSRQFAARRKRNRKMQEPHFSHNKAQTNMKMITKMVDILRHYCVCLWRVCNFLLANINLVRIQGRGSRGKQRKHGGCLSWDQSKNVNICKRLQT